MRRVPLYDDVETLLLSRNHNFLALFDKAVEKLKKQGGSPFSAVEEEVKTRVKEQREAT